MKTSTLPTGILICLLIFGCQAEEDNTGSVADTDTGGDSSDNVDTDTGFGNAVDGGDVPEGGCSGIDLLFVIDDSGSMGEEQANLTTNFPEFIKVLDNYKAPNGSSIDYRIGVTTTSVNRSYKIPSWPSPMPTTSTGADGVLLGQNICGLTQPWLEGPGANVETDFSCMASVGVTGSGTEMPFAAMEQALGDKSEAGQPNHGFYRRDENSLLVVVIITDEDDCSIEKGGTMVTGALGVGGSDCNPDKSKGLYSSFDMIDFLNGISGGDGRFVLVGIGGPSACSSSFGSANWAKRVQELTGLAGEYGFFGNICAGDLWVSLEKALDVIQVTCDGFGPI